MEVNGVLHCHSTYSYDGKLSLPELKDFFLERQVSFVCLSEHTDELDEERAVAFVAECRALSDDTFLFVPGFEIPYQDTHVLLYGCDEFPGQVAADAAALRAAASAATFVVLAHPVRNNFVIDDELKALLQGIEIWNQQYDGKPMARPRSMQLLRTLRQNTPDLLATGGLDLHRGEHFGTPLTTIDVSSLNEDLVMQALQSGAYTFGAETFQIEAKADWQPSLIESCKSQLTIALIRSGKGINRLLAEHGLAFPRALKQCIRRFV